MEFELHLRIFRSLALDVAVPVGAYFGLKALGTTDLTALLAGGGVAALSALMAVAIQRRLRPMSVYICALFVLTGALALMFNEPRLLLLKTSITTLAVGFSLLFLAARPKTLGALLEPLVSRGAEDRAERWRQAWAERPPLRRALRLAAALAGGLLLSESAARAAIIFSLTISQAVILAHGPAVVVVLLLLLIVRVLVAPAVTRAMAE